MASETLQTIFGWILGRRETSGTSTVAAGAPDIADILDAVIASMPDAAIVLDRAGQVVAFNAAARTIAPALNRHAPASLALRVPEVVKAVREVAEDGGSEAVREGAEDGGSRSVEFAQRVPVDRWFKAHIQPFGGARPFSMMLLTFQDLTPLHRVEEMRADFVANASHELRTPLAALSGFIDTLQGPAREDVTARERFLGIMHAQATRMARLIDDLLSLSRVELSAHVRPDNLVDLLPIIRQVADGLEPLASERHVHFEIDLPADAVMIVGDREELRRLF